jgi:hypothetical protein
MNKHLIRNEQEYVELFEDFDLTHAERFLNVEFAFMIIWQGNHRPCGGGGIAPP